jgi:hypothetical protein
MSVRKSTKASKATVKSSQPAEPQQMVRRIILQSQGRRERPPEGNDGRLISYFLYLFLTRTKERKERLLRIYLRV